MQITCDAQALVREASPFGADGDLHEVSDLSQEDFGYTTVNATSLSGLSGSVHSIADGMWGFLDASLDGSIRIVC
jgi:hypothetical protein